MIESLAFDEKDMSCDSHTFSKPLDFDSSNIQKDSLRVTVILISLRSVCFNL
jgi:hypothetical protein